MSELAIAALLSVVSFIAWFISMIVGGGSTLLLMPAATLLLGAPAVAPALTIGSVVGNLQRCALLWPHINWAIVCWQVPGVIAGSLMGAYAFTQIAAAGLQRFIAVALLLMVLHALLGDRINLPNVTLKKWHFLPLGFINAALSGLIGSTGPLLLPAYLSYGLEKESLIATRATNLSITHLAKIVAYSLLGVFSPTLVAYGLMMGGAALPANWLGQKVLEKISPQQFQIAVFSFMGISSMWMLWQQRAITLP